jgi:hypothetical protein
LTQLVAAPSLWYVAKGELADGAFEIAFARQLEEPHARFVDMIDVSQARLDRRHDVEQSALALEQRHTAQVLTIEHQQIERAEERVRRRNSR